MKLTEIREVQLQILDAIHEFCKQYGLRYSLGGGTLLGAIRHKGFIPWDDDVDIMMPRPDYEFFLNNFSHKQIQIQHPHNDSNAYIVFAKVYNTQTILKEHYAENGVFVDLFPIDGLPEESKLSDYIKTQNRAMQYLYKIHDYKTGVFYQYEPNKPQWVVCLKYWLKHLFYPSRKKCISIIDNLHSSYEFSTSKYAGAICGAYAHKEHMPQDTFMHYINVNFEDREYMSIKSYDSYLTKHYGEYMQLPPEEQRVSPHHFISFWK